MKRLLLLIAVLLGSIVMFAQPRSEEQAKQIASDFFKKKPLLKAPKLSVVPQQEVRQTIQKKVSRAKSATSLQPSSCYIINDEANNRYVIVSADERMYEILGYSDESIFDARKMPIALYELINNYDRQYSLIKETANIQTSNKKYSINNVTPIPPMITSKWGQSEPFNANCPLDKSYSYDTLSVTGCIATAMAQIINYWKHPTNCTGGTYYYFNPYYYGLQLLYFDYDNYRINWNNLVDNYLSATEEQEKEVAKLMYACGVSVAMGYSAEGSGSMDYNIPYALKHYFGYNSNIVYRNRDYYTRKEWHTMIMNELISGRPVLYAGYSDNNGNKSGGHEFILDGCDDEGRYHINMGTTFNLYGILFSGIGDGLYYLDAIKPSFLGEELGDFSYYQSMVINITPETYGNHEDTFYAPYFSFKNLGNSFYFQIIANCYSSDANDYFATDERFNGTIGVGLFDQDFNYIQSLFSESVSMKSDSVFTKILEKVELNVSSLSTNKDYYIAPYALSEGYNNPTRIRALPPDSEKDDENRKAVDFYYKANRESNMLVLNKVIIYVDDDPDPDPDKIGDANNDGAVDVSDIVCIVNYILEKTVEPFNFNNADVNEDGEIDVADIALVVSIIMTSEVKPAQEFFTTNEIEVYESSQGNYTMSLPSINQYAASQFDLIVPSGTSVQEISLNENQLQDHQLTYTKIGDNRYRVIVYSPKNNTFASNTDNLLTIMTSNGNSPIEIENAVFATNLGEKHNFDTTWSQATGINGIIAGKHGRSVFTLDGRSISPYRLSKGIYIINGEKHIVK